MANVYQIKLPGNLKEEKKALTADIEALMINAAQKTPGDGMAPAATQAVKDYAANLSAEQKQDVAILRTIRRLENHASKQRRVFGAHQRAAIVADVAANLKTTFLRLRRLRTV